MAITTEPGMRVARSKDITLEDYADAIDRIDPAQTPYMTMARTEVKLNAVDRTWNVDSFASVKGARGRADNEAAPASGSADSADITSNIRKIGNVAQAFSRTWRLGWISDVPKIAGVKDTFAYAKATQYELLKQDAEAAFCSLDQVAVYDQSPGLGAVCAGYRKLVDNANSYAAASAYAIGKPSDVHYAPTAAGLSGALTAVHSRAMWKSVAKALRVAAKVNGDWTVLAGLDLKQAVTDLTIPTSISATGGTAAPGQALSNDQVRVILANESDSVLGGSVDVVRTDFGRFMIVPTDYIGTTTTDATGGALSAVNTASGGAAGRASASFVASLKSGIILKKGNTFKTWAKLPYTEQLAKDGGGDAYDAKQLVTHGLDNPIKAGFLHLT